MNNTSEEKRFGHLRGSLPQSLEDYLARFPQPVLLVDAFDDAPPLSPYDTPQSYSLEQAAAHSETIASDAFVFWLRGPLISIGRTSDNDIALDHASISKVHAALRDEESGWLIEDTHSTNGTLVNAVQLDPLVAHALSDLDWIVFGEVRARFVLPETFWTLATS